MDDVESEVKRNAESCSLNGDPLVVVGLVGPGHVEKRTDESLLDTLFVADVVLNELPDLFLQRHLAEELFHFLVHGGPVGHTAWATARAGARLDRGGRRGHHARAADAPVPLGRHIMTRVAHHLAAGIQVEAPLARGGVLRDDERPLERAAKIGGGRSPSGGRVMRATGAANQEERARPSKKHGRAYETSEVRKSESMLR